MLVLFFAISWKRLNLNFLEGTRSDVITNKTISTNLPSKTVDSATNPDEAMSGQIDYFMLLWMLNANDGSSWWSLYITCVL